MFPYQEIENKIGYVFANKQRLEEAFIHSTYAHKNGGEDNERVEFLGDTVLQFVVTDWLYHAYPKAHEGELTKIRAKLVCEEALLEAVERLDIGKYLRIEGSKANVGKKTVSSLFEAVAGAIYLDGGYEAAKAFVTEHGICHYQQQTQNPKSKLQEYLQGRGEALPTYQTQKSGKDNAPQFTCTVTAGGKSAQGVGGSKKLAETQAAENLLARLIKTATRKKK